jgi:hypothetical protein
MSPSIARTPCARAGLLLITNVLSLLLATTATWSPAAQAANTTVGNGQRGSEVALRYVYAGSPAVNQAIAGSGSVRKR